MVTGERTEVYMLSLTNRVGRMVYNSLKLKQTQTQHPNLWPCLRTALILGNAIIARVQK